jgi:hypothetical protein
MPKSNEPVIPELVMFQTIKSALHELRKDWTEKPENKTFLYRCIGNYNSIQKYDFLTQAKSVFFRAQTPNEPRYLDVSMGFDSDRIQKKMPTIHIILQGENPKDDSLGLGIGNFEDDFYEGGEDEPDTYSVNNSRRFSQQINLLISGDNSNEKLLIYHVLKSILIAYVPYLQELGLENVSFSGSDVQINTGVAGNMYMRNLMIRYDYDLKIPSLMEDEFITKIFYGITIKQND